MSAAIKCDICGCYKDYGTEVRNPLISVWATKTHHYYPEELILCSVCYGSYELATEQWLKLKRPDLYVK